MTTSVTFPYSILKNYVVFEALNFGVGTRKIFDSYKSLQLIKSQIIERIRSRIFHLGIPLRSVFVWPLFGVTDVVIYFYYYFSFANATCLIK